MFEHIIYGGMILLLSYAFGSISIGRIALRILSNDEDSDIVNIDEMQIGDEKINLPMGANTVSVKHGSTAGCIVSLIDILKGAAPTLAIRLLFPEQSYYLLAALGVIIGHIWPVYFKFVGGVGIGTMMGALVVVDWLSVPVAVLTSLIIGLLILQNMVAIFFILLITIIPWMWIRFGDLPHIAFAFMLLILFVLAMIPSLRVYQHKIKEGTAKEDMRKAMESSAMGRGMNRIIDFIKFKPRSEK